VTTEDLVALISLIQSLDRSEACKGDFADIVKGNMPDKSQEIGS
jgi:hypothetical protein